MDLTNINEALRSATTWFYRVAVYFFIYKCQAKMKKEIYDLHFFIGTVKWILRALSVFALLTKQLLFIFFYILVLCFSYCSLSEVYKRFKYSLYLVP